ncbi:MAG: hypothetical protein AAFO77_00970 [Pseudomonadota bacterium]
MITHHIPSLPMPIARIAEVVLRSLERTAKLYEKRVREADGYDAKLTDDGSKLTQALNKVHQAQTEALEQRQLESGALSERQKRDLMMRLETEIEATIAKRLEAAAQSLPSQCADCGAAIPKLAIAPKPTTASGK